MEKLWETRDWDKQNESSYCYLRMGWPTWYQHATCMDQSSSWSRTKMLRRFSYPADFWGPRHHNCVGDGGGQSDERGDVDGAAGPFWFNSILSWRQISLQTQSRAHHLWFWATGTTCRKRGDEPQQRAWTHREITGFAVDLHTQVRGEMILLWTARLW